HTRSDRDWSSDVCSSDLAAARDRWEHVVGAVSIAVLAATLLLCMGALLEWRARAHRTRPFVVATAALLAMVVVAWAVLRIAIGRSEERRVGKEWRARWGV